MRAFFCSLLPKKEEDAPFTTQGEVLEKYNQGMNDKSKVVGMCRPMSNVFLGRILQKEDPTELLKNDRKFLAAAIEEENEELDSGDADVNHFAFKANGVSHTDETIAKKDLTEQKLTDLLKENDHLLITYPRKGKEDLEHEVYLGNQGMGSCRFFDANIEGGQRTGECSKLLSQVVKLIQSEYTETDEPFHVGMGRSV